MTADEAVVAVVAALEAAGVPFMVVGSLASNFHGIPRSTQDADFVVQLEPDDLQRLEQHLRPGLVLQHQAAFETITGTTRYLITQSGSPFVGELFLLSDDPHDLERFARRVRVRLLGHDAFVASAEDMIITKLRWAVDARRTKDRDDVRNILAVQGSALDWTYLERWSTTHGTAGLLEQIKASIPPA